MNEGDGHGGAADRDSQGTGPGSLGSTVITIAVLALFLYFIRLVLIPFVAAGALAFILSPIVDYLTRRRGIARGAAGAIVVMILAAICAAAAYVAYPSIASGGLGFASDLRSFLTKAISDIAKGQEIHILGSTYDAAQLADLAQSAFRDWIAQPNNLIMVAGAGFSSVFNLFLVGVLLFYFLLSGRQIVASAVGLAPPARRSVIEKILERVEPVLRRYFIGVGIIIGYASIAAYIGLGLILGIKHAVLLALATGLLELLPVLGPLLSAVLAGLVALKGASSIWDVLAYVIYAAALRLSIDQLFGPLVLGRAASLSPVAVIFSFLAGGILYGIAGVIMAVPVALTVRITLKTIYGEAPDVE